MGNHIDLVAAVMLVEEFFRVVERGGKLLRVGLADMQDYFLLRPAL